MTEEEKKAIEFLDKYKEYTILEENKALNILLNLVKKQQEEIEKKDKIIYEMAKMINELDSGVIYCGRKTECSEYCEDCIKQYFENKVEGSK